MTDKNTDPGLLSRNIHFGWINPFLGQLSAPVVEQLAALRTGPAGAKNRLGYVRGTLEGAADKDSGAGGLYRVKGIDLTESMGIELNAELGGQLCIAGWRVQADGEHHHVKLLFLHPILGGGVPDGYITGFRVFFCYGDVAPDKPDTGKVLRPLEETLKVLAVGANIVMEHSTLRIRLMVFG